MVWVRISYTFNTMSLILYISIVKGVTFWKSTSWSWLSSLYHGHSTKFHKVVVYKYILYTDCVRSVEWWVFQDMGMYDSPIGCSHPGRPAENHGNTDMQHLGGERDWRWGEWLLCFYVSHSHNKSNITRHYLNCFWNNKSLIVMVDSVSHLKMG